MTHRQLYLDSDGVLMDLGKKVIEVFGSEEWEEERAQYHADRLCAQVGRDEFVAKQREYRRKATRLAAADFWERLYAVEDLFEILEPMPDAHELVSAVRHLNPIILTGCPRGYWAVAQKMKARDKHFPGIPMICAESARKADFCRKGDVIIDDWPKYRDVWEQKGGIWVHHDNTADTLAELKRLEWI